MIYPPAVVKRYSKHFCLPEPFTPTTADSPNLHTIAVESKKVPNRGMSVSAADH